MANFLSHNIRLFIFSISFYLPPVKEALHASQHIPRTPHFPPVLEIEMISSNQNIKRMLILISLTWLTTAQTLRTWIGWTLGWTGWWTAWRATRRPTGSICRALRWTLCSRISSSTSSTSRSAVCTRRRLGARCGYHFRTYLKSKRT